MMVDSIEQMQDAERQTEPDQHKLSETASNAKQTAVDRPNRLLSAVCGVVLFAMITSTSICWITSLYDDVPIIDPVNVKTGFIVLMLASTTAMAVFIIYAALKQSMCNGFAIHFWTTFLSTLLTSGSVIYMLISTIAFSKCLFYFGDKACVWVYLRVVAFILSLIFLVVQVVFMHFTPIPKWKMYKWLKNLCFLLILTTNYCIWMYFVLDEFQHFIYHEHVHSLIPCMFNVTAEVTSNVTSYLTSNVTREDHFCLAEGIHHDWHSIKEHAAIFLYGCILENCLLSTSSIWHKFNGKCEVDLKTTKSIQNGSVETGDIIASYIEQKQFDISIALGSKLRDQSFNQVDKSIELSNQFARFSKTNVKSPMAETRFEVSIDSKEKSCFDKNKAQVIGKQNDNSSSYSTDAGSSDTCNKNDATADTCNRNDATADTYNRNEATSDTYNRNEAIVDHIDEKDNVTAESITYIEQSTDKLTRSTNSNDLKTLFSNSQKKVFDFCGYHLSTIVIAIVFALNVFFVTGVGLYVMANHDIIADTRLSFHIFWFVGHLLFLFIPSLLATFVLYLKPKIHSNGTEQHSNWTEKHSNWTEQHSDRTEQHSDRTDQTINETEQNSNGTGQNSNGTGQNSNGTEQHSNGTEQYSNWTEQHSDRTEQNSDRTDQTSNETEQNSNGTGQNSNGTGQYSNVTEQNSNVIEQHSNGTEQHINGTGQNSNGTEQHSNETEQHSNGTGQNSNGTEQHSNGTEQHSNGTGQNSNWTGQYSNVTGQNSNGTAQHSNGTEQQSNGTGQNSKGTDQHSNVIEQYSNGTEHHKNGTEQYNNSKIHFNYFVFILTATGSCIFYWLNLSAIFHVDHVCSQNSSAEFGNFKCSEESYKALFILKLILKLLSLVFQIIIVLKLGSYPQNSSLFALLRFFIIILAIGNFGFWTVASFILNFEKFHTIQNTVFGEKVWFIVMHVVFPCMTFFRLYCFEILIDFSCKDVPMKLWSALVYKRKGRCKSDS